MKIILFLLSAVSFGFILLFGFMNLHVQMGIMIIPFLTFLVFANLEKISEFEISKDGIKAKMIELDNTLKYTQEIAVLLASTELSTLSRSGNLGGISKNEKENIKNELLKKLHAIGISEYKIENDVLVHWKNYTRSDYYSSIYKHIESILRSRPFSKDDNDFIEFNNKFKMSNTDYLGNISKYDELKSFIKDKKIIDDKLNELISNFEYYLKNDKHKSIENWLIS